MSYDIYKDITGQWRWRLRAANGRIIATSSESYYNRADCLRAIELIKSSSGNLSYDIYQDLTGQWRWRSNEANGRIIATSAESYYNRADCLSVIELIKSSGNAPVYDANN